MPSAGLWRGLAVLALALFLTGCTESAIDATCQDGLSGQFFIPALLLAALLTTALWMLGYFAFARRRMANWNLAGKENRAPRSWAFVVLGRVVPILTMLGYVIVFLLADCPASNKIWLAAGLTLGYAVGLVACMVIVRLTKRGS